jgi:antitoxin component YwqK of YwqJK toxin-antitoxin module
MNLKKYLISFSVMALFFACTSNKEYSYFDTGELKSEYDLRKNARHGIGKTYYKSGEIYQLSNWINGKKEGLSETFYRNGNKEISSTFVEGKQNGWTYKYDSSGALIGKMMFNDDIADGDFEEYYPDGSILKSGENFDDAKSYKMYGYYEDGTPKGYQFNKFDSVVYSAMYDYDGRVISSHLPISIDYNDQLCLNLMHSIFSKEDISIRIYPQDISSNIINKYSEEYFQNDGMSICISNYPRTNGKIQGYLCEVYNENNQVYSCMKFEYEE